MNHEQRQANRTSGLLRGLAHLGGLSGARRVIVSGRDRFEGFIDGHLKLGSVIGLSFCLITLSAAYIRLSFGILKTSDDAAFVLEAQDIIHGNILLHGWTLSPDSYYTILVPLYVTIGLVTHLGTPMYLVPPIVYAILVTLCVAVAWRRVEVEHRAISILFILTIIALPSSLFADLSDVTHVSTVILILVTFCLLAANQGLVLASVPLILANTGDPFSWWVGTLPIALVGLQLVIGNQKRGLRVVVFAATCFLASRLLSAAIRLAGGFNSGPSQMVFVPLDKLTNNLYLFFESILELFGADFFGHQVFSVGTGILLIHCLVLGFIVWVMCVEAKRAARGEESMLILLLVTAVFANALAFIFSTAPADLSTARYLPTVPIFGALVAALSWHKLGLAKTKYLFYAAPFVLAGYVWAFGIHVLAPVAEPPQSVIEFLSGSGLTEGYGAYWSAGIFTVWSDHRVTIRQVTSGLDGRLIPFEWFSARQWYNTGRARFLIYQDPESWNGNLGANLQSAVRTWGRPDHAAVVDGYHILVWRSPLWL